MAKDEQMTKIPQEEFHQVVEISKTAIKIFGSEEEAEGWLFKPLPLLEGKMPIEIMTTDTGRAQVQDLLNTMLASVNG